MIIHPKLGKEPLFLEDIKAGRVYSLEEVAKELGDEDHIRKMKKRR
jgi:hypothetical protein